MRTARPVVLLALLVLAVGINYIDRGSLSVAKTELSLEFDLDSAQMGLLFSAFFWSYALCQLAAGWMVDRFDVKWVYAGGFLIWSLATLAMGVVGGFTAFVALRLMLGAGESVAFPATSRVIVENFAEHRRGFANALVDAGSKIGPASSMLLGGLIVAYWGWRAMFLILGIASLMWLVPWIALAPSHRSRTDSTPDDTGERSRVGFAQLLVRREVWGTSLGFFCLGYAWYFLVSWLPAYLEEERGFSKEAMAVFGSLPFWAMAATSVLGGWLSDRWIANGSTPTLVRKSFLIAGLLFCAAFLYAASIAPSDTSCIALLILACASLGFYSSNAWAVTQTLAGPQAAGQWSGLQNAIGNMGGVASPALTGWIVKETGSFSLAFTAASVMLVVGVFAYLFLLPKIAPLEWNCRRPSPT
ncbi:MAG: MFS transporter [Planctomycetaceae bacterium]|nr:MFS transporter [Planctomycetaceae bacterium]